MRRRDQWTGGGTIELFTCRIPSFTKAVAMIFAL
jgi:hypothetical protein